MSATALLFTTYITPTRKKTVFLLHGYGVNRTMWSPQLSALSGVRVIVPDIRGHGASRPCPSFTVPEAARDIHALAKAEGCEKPLLIDLSMGGCVVQEYASLFPDRLGGCMVVDQVPIFARYKRWERFAVRHSASLLNLYPWETLKREMSKASADTERARQELLRLFGDMNKAEFITSWNGLATCLHEMDMKFEVPLYFVYGEHDKTGSIVKMASEWPRLYPGCTVKKIKDAGHLSNWDQTEEFNSVMREFLESCANI